MKTIDNEIHMSETEFDADILAAQELTCQGFRVFVHNDTDQSIEMILGARTAFDHGGC